LYAPKRTTLDTEHLSQNYMNTSLLIITSLLAIFIVLLSEQIPRYCQYRDASKQRPAPNGADSPTQKNRVTSDPRQQDTSCNETRSHPMTDGTDTPTRGSDNDEVAAFTRRSWRRKDARPQPLTDGTHTPTRGGESDTMAASTRRPWDPPFPQRQATNSEWLVLPPSASRRTEEEGGDVQEEAQADVKEDEVVGDERATAPAANKPKEKKGNKSTMSVLWLLLAMLSAILLILGFAILIAHCLAWFIVYKTEARLGEARRGLVQGGEMRLCLCVRN
jgi:hypothetical protein